MAEANRMVGVTVQREVNKTNRTAGLDISRADFCLLGISLAGCPGKLPRREKNPAELVDLHRQPPQDRKVEHPSVQKA